MHVFYFDKSVFETFMHSFSICNIDVWSDIRRVIQMVNLNSILRVYRMCNLTVGRLKSIEGFGN